MDRSTIYGLAACLILLVACSKDSATNAPEPAASQGAEATPEPQTEPLPQPGAPDPAAAPAEEPAQTIAPTPPIPAPDTALSDGQLVGILQTLNSGEIDQAQLAQSKAKDARVKKFASMMITQHREALQKTKQLGKAESLTAADSVITNDLKVAGDADLDTLKGAGAADFDARYMTNQVKAHEAALDMLTNRLIPAAADPKLKALLESTRDTVAKHLKHANEIQQALLSAPPAR